MQRDLRERSFETVNQGAGVHSPYCTAKTCGVKRMIYPMIVMLIPKITNGPRMTILSLASANAMVATKPAAYGGTLRRLALAYK